jgi:CRP-like cAMP-binding protein
MAPHLPAASAGPETAGARKNCLLASLPEPEFWALASGLQYVCLPRGKLLCEPGRALTHLYFPISGIVSLLHGSDSGVNTVLALVGREGMLGLGVLLGGQDATVRAVVQAPGHAYRLPAAHAKACFAEGKQFQVLTLRFTHALMVELCQTAICNQRHSVEQQLCRWLLLCLDRLQGVEIEMTQELIASTLGVRRQSITEAARRLEKRSIISYFRGCITVLDRHALEQAACECYGMAKRVTEILLPNASPPLAGTGRLPRRHQETLERTSIW